MQQILIPLVCAFIVYIYNYREVADIKARINLIKDIMEERDKFFLEKFDKVFSEISDLKSRISKLEARIGVYVGVAIFVSSAILKFIDKLMA